ncbi:MAG TPA: M24 family metallopeptidase [Synergistaceae bacterium]|nr:M24 family metallopeptidase [Synergistaceae bacterium]HPQ37361.1 M24 family metallopeptidase [Synergistaceae bacterium]
MLVREKVAQAIALLRELSMDCWLVFVRETFEQADPAMRFIAGEDVVGQGVFLFFPDGEAIALTASFDASAFEKSRIYSRVESYVEDVGPLLKNVLEEKNPRTIGLNYSEMDYAADGLTHGMYRKLHTLLEGTDFPSRFVSAQPLMCRLRGRKSPEELRRIKKAAEETLDLFRLLESHVVPGWTCRGVSDFLHEEMKRRDLKPSWSYAGDPAVHCGSSEDPGHGAPGEEPLVPGSLLHLDFGILREGYASDLQRVWYLARGDEAIPEDMERAFSVVRRGIAEAARIIRPGILGHEVDRVVREIVTSAGYPEYAHALGHQVGILAHDGGALLGPRWKRYGDLVSLPLEENQVFTLEFGVMTSGGYLGQEEMIQITPEGCIFLAEPQERIWRIALGG